MSADIHKDRQGIDGVWKPTGWDSTRTPSEIRLKLDLAFASVCAGLSTEKGQSVARATLSRYSGIDITLLGRRGRVEGKRGLLI